MNTLSQHQFLFTLIHWAVSAFSLMATAYVVPGFKVGSFWSALFTAFAIGLADTFIRPFLLFLTLPFNILTLGLFTFVVNGMILKICAFFMPKFEIRTWVSAIVGAFVLATINTFLHYFLI